LRKTTEVIATSKNSTKILAVSSEKKNYSRYIIESEFKNLYVINKERITARKANLYEIDYSYCPFICRNQN
jgi:hypothetical protein